MANVNEPTTNYVILTPEGVLHGFSQVEPSEQQLALQAMLAPEQTMTAHEWVERYSEIWLDMFIEEGWVEVVDKAIIAPHVQLDDFLRYVSASLSGSRRVAIGSDEGFCLAKMGFTQQEADTLCVAAADFFDFLKRQQQRGWAVHGHAISFFSTIDMLMPNTSFIFLWINNQGYWIIIEDEPLLNNRAFVELVWGIKATGERFNLLAEQVLDKKAQLESDQQAQAEEQKK
ncbi:hypothetical protein ACGTJS_12305 [Faucicola mancuniensis]|uniref:hypothetical protein n=1 Tax=Faucicola mancuniensis TaxID=1309795 RepID=UPI0039777E95